ncbi:MAG: ParB-like nuclease domain-containing protein [bacterium]|nr:ParB-like nuclease domain-containing protein [bacterium]
MTDKDGILRRAYQLADELAQVEDIDTRVFLLNGIREQLHEVSPFKDEPVDFVRWSPIDEVVANDYNPNAVAPPEMQLLELSIDADGYTQPIVTCFDDERDVLEVVDGFHRNRVARESEVVGARIQGHLPTVQIRDEQQGRPDRIASTIRHNRARGKHQVEQMSSIVLELKRRNWSDKKIGKELGMDPDEVLRLAQITGLAEAFADHEFSAAWEVDQTADDDTVLEIVEEIDA